MSTFSKCQNQFYTQQATKQRANNCPVCIVEHQAVPSTEKFGRIFQTAKDAGEQEGTKRCPYQNPYPVSCIDLVRLPLSQEQIVAITEDKRQYFKHKMCTERGRANMEFNREIHSRLLKNLRLLRCASTVLNRSIDMRLIRDVLRALHPNLFEQPIPFRYCNSLIGRVLNSSDS